MNNSALFMRGLGPNQKKILILLLGGALLSVVYSPKQYFRVVRAMRKEWKKIPKSTLESSVQKLYKSHLVKAKQQKDGTWKIMLTKHGQKLASLHDFETLQIKKLKKWDQKWRVVIFDIPEKKKVLRDVFRGWLKRLGFYKLQGSVFVYPYDCRNEFDFLVEYYQAGEYAHFIVAEEIDNEADLKKIFSLK
ncbi:MAG: hypothetical protein A3E38_01935 [Candidatus Moranbacteria bacterium RIFCSPHIGHO2_12_FULL_54_9]|nr:MAG: hypothetical protein A3E38_01935 [Candidatus Moranbacteria bacterium RIFCSPHIGHO2_12_FULL_54_9]